nr:reverse transcriptase [Chroomonas collegionis]
MNRSVATNSSWETLPWIKFHKRVFRLQSKIYDAMRKKDLQKTLKLQKLLLNDKVVHYVAIKTIIENKNYVINCGTSSYQGLDSKNNFTFVSKLAKEIKDGMYLTSKLIFNPTVKDPKKLLASLSNENQMVHFIWGLALSPVYKALLFKKESEVRRKVGLIHLPYEIKKTLRKSSEIRKKKILKIDLTTCFSSINHKIVLKKLILPVKHKVSIYQALKLGFIDPTSGLNLSKSKIDRFPLLLVNMFFHGLENLCGLFIGSKPFFSSSQKACYGFRYGPYLLYIFETEDSLIIDSLKRSLCILGIDLNFLDIMIVKAQCGFDFLGWRFIVRQNRNVFAYPNDRNWLSYKSKIKSILRSQKNEITIRIKTIAHTTKKWHIYHSNCELYPLKSHLYKLHSWCLRYLRVSTTMSKEDRYLSIKNVFNTPLNFHF